MKSTLRKPSGLARLSITCPAAHEVDAAPQLLVVTLAEAALLAIDRALDSAHPILASTTRLDRTPPGLVTTEHLAVQILDVAGQLTELLGQYVAEIHFQLTDDLHRHDDLF